MADSEFEFTDNTMKVKSLLENKVMVAVEEACGELESQVKRNTKVGKVNRQLKNSWKHHVIRKGDKTIGTIGSPLEYSIWYELGTGEHALNGDGRTGGWYIPVGSGKNEISEEVVNAYGFKVIVGKNDKKFVHTYGMKPRRPLHKAYTSLKNKLIRRIQNEVKGGLS